MIRSALLVVAFTLAAPVMADPIASERVRVVDGDTIRLDGGPPVRLVGFNAPEIRNHAECAAEREKGKEAARRLRQLVSGGGLDLSFVPCACPAGQEGTAACNHGRRCAVLRVRGKEVGAALVAEGLAVPFQCGASRCPPTPRPWCAS